MWGKTLGAAQFDGNNASLSYRGGSGDSGSLLERASAIKIAEATLAGIQSSDVNAKPLALTEKTMDVSVSSTVAGTHKELVPQAPRPGVSVASGSLRSGFLWKPVSESDGKLVVLLPARLSGKVSSAAVYSSIPPTETNKIEEGRFSGDQKNGGRAHFRFQKPGRSYPDNAYVVATMKDGSLVAFSIGNSRARNE